MASPGIRRSSRRCCRRTRWGFSSVTSRSHSSPWPRWFSPSPGPKPCTPTWGISVARRSPGPGSAWCSRPASSATLGRARWCSKTPPAPSAARSSCWCPSGVGCRWCCWPPPPPSSPPRRSSPARSRCPTRPSSSDTCPDCGSTTHRRRRSARSTSPGSTGRYSKIRLMDVFDGVKRVFVGRPLHSDRMEGTLLPKRVALAVFCSDPISSVAYATEQILLVLAAGGLAALATTPWVALAVILLLVTVVASYRQTCYAYPNGGGAYVVSRENLGESASLAAAAALLVDYVMTVAVSVTSGVVAVTSAIPALSPHAVILAVGLILALTVANLRGTRESGRVFAIPTYAFVGLTLVMFVWAGFEAVTGGLPQASTAGDPLPDVGNLTSLALLLLVVRAFASGCTALTGVEAISTGVPSFERPKARNAAATLTLMGIIAVVLFGGITVLAVALQAQALPDGNPSVISQIAAAVFGGSSVVFYLFQAATAAILILAANTAFNGFPGLASILARDSYLPRQLHNRGDRLVFSNGVVLLAGAAAALIIGFDANIDRLIQLYIVGVFTSFTLSQFGMVKQ